MLIHEAPSIRPLVNGRSRFSTGRNWSFRLVAGVFAAFGPAAAAAGSTLEPHPGGLVAAGNATSSAQLAAVHPESVGTYVTGGVSSVGAGGC